MKIYFTNGKMGKIYTRTKYENIYNFGKLWLSSQIAIVVGLL